MFDVFFKIPTYWLFRNIGKPDILPLALTLKVTNRCNAKCKTCNIHSQDSNNELVLSEFEKTFSNFDGKVFWLTLTGGEPFLRQDLIEICQLAYKNLHPKIITIATNGILHETIPKAIKRVLTVCPNTFINLNLSLDGFGQKHDDIRGVKDNFKLAMQTYKELQTIDSPDFTLGINTILSKYNVKDSNEFFPKLLNFGSDTYLVEIAQEKTELNNIGYDVQPHLEDYFSAIDCLKNELKKKDYKGLSKIIQSFRLQYYDYTKKMLKEKRGFFSCYAGFASAYISHNGEVFACCVKDKRLGDLRQEDYDFCKIWFGRTADEVRQVIKNERCFCPVVGINYLNMLYDINSLFKIGLNFLRLS
jgi:MoaA/NifB/PqqE/SkfB family radical SAM enzyme